MRPGSPSFSTANRLRKAPGSLSKSASKRAGQGRGEQTGCGICRKTVRVLSFLVAFYVGFLLYIHTTHIEAEQKFFNKLDHGKLRGFKILPGLSEISHLVHHGSLFAMGDDDDYYGDGEGVDEVDGNGNAAIVLVPETEGEDDDDTVHKQAGAYDKMYKQALAHDNAPKGVEEDKTHVPDASSHKHKQAKQSESESHEPVDSDLNIVFSTDCSDYQDWQSLVLFYSASKVGQQGHITRIASGCSIEKAEELRKFYAKLQRRDDEMKQHDVGSSSSHTKTKSSFYNVHFTDDFKRAGKEDPSGESYDFYNKPFGVLDYLTANDPKSHPDNAASAGLTPHSVIAIIDPDFLFLRPLTVRIKDHPANIYPMGFETLREHIPEYVTEGYPVGQLYGIGAPWTQEKWHDTSRRTPKQKNNFFDITSLCPSNDKNDKCTLREVTTKQGEEHYSLGPPYIAHINDMQRIAKTWVQMVPKVYEGYPHLLAEMYAYALASAQEGLPHFTLVNHMVSNVDVPNDAEGWSWVDILWDNTCEDPQPLKAPIKPIKELTAQEKRVSLLYPGKEMPTFLHYCQFYRIMEYGFQKRRYGMKHFQCDQPLLKEPPTDIGTERMKVRLDDGKDGKREEKKLKPLPARRNAFMICAITKIVNAAVLDAREVMCNGEGEGKGQEINTHKTVNLAVDWP